MEPIRYTIRKGQIVESDFGPFASKEEAEREGRSAMSGSGPSASLTNRSA